jgi:N-acetylmuramoyl-L-alanine amidase
MTYTLLRATSPNQSARPVGVGIDCLVLHADAGSTDEGTVSWVKSATSQVSYHYLIGRTGTVWQFVDDERKAWHAGVSEFKGRKNCNDFSIGVAFANDQKGEAFTEAAIDAGVELCALLCLRHNIPLDRITTHAVISPGRKTDPGPLFSLATFVARVKAELTNG